MQNVKVVKNIESVRFVRFVSVRENATVQLGLVVVHVIASRSEENKPKIAMPRVNKNAASKHETCSVSSE
jgi:hypothetical protein